MNYASNDEFFKKYWTSKNLAMAPSTPSRSTQNRYMDDPCLPPRREHRIH
jgi:hypothetical protein